MDKWGTGIDDKTPERGRRYYVFGDGRKGGDKRSNVNGEERKPIGSGREKSKKGQSVLRKKKDGRA